MGLNIKNERVHALARQAAVITGLSQTGVIERALEKLLAEYGHDEVEAARLARIDLATRIAVDYRTCPDVTNHEIGMIEDLYDEQGLPR